MLMILAMVLLFEAAVVGWPASSLRALAAPRGHILDAALMLASVWHSLLLLGIGTGGLYIAAVIGAGALPHLTMPMPAWAAILTYAVAVDFLFYWMHRAFHTRWLWPIHKLHHVERDLTPLVAFRFHPLNAVVDPIWRGLPLIFLGVSADQAAWVLIIAMAQGFVAHSRLPWSLAPWLVGPREHGLHHSALPQYRDRNFGGQLLIWDHLFGTLT